MANEPDARKRGRLKETAGKAGRTVLSVTLAALMFPAAAFAQPETSLEVVSWADSNTVSNTSSGSVTANSITVNASKTELADDDVTLSATEFMFNGKSQKPTVTVTKGETSLTVNTDYTVEVGASNMYAGTYTVTVTGTGSYGGTVTKSYEIKKADLTDSTTNMVTVDPASFTGYQVEPTVYVKIGTKRVTAVAGGFEVSYANNSAVGTGTVTVTAKSEGSSFTGSQTAEFNIQAAKLSSVTDEANFTGTNSNGNITFNTLAKNSILGSASYTGSPQNPDIPQLILFTNATGGQLRYDLTADDYTTEGWTNNTDAGEASITLTGKGNFTGSLTLNWTIEQKSLADSDVTVSGLDDQTWTGTAVTPPAPTVKVGERTLVAGADYDVTYGTNLTDVGSVDVTITGKGNYTGTVPGQFFRIGKSLASAEVTVADGSVYTGQAVTPAVTVKIGDDALTADEDYTVSYDNNVNAGTAKVTVKGADDYIGEVAKEFTIAKAELAVPAAAGGLVYTGKELTGVAAPAEGAGYTVTGNTGTNAGDYSATLTADDNHTFANGAATASVPWSIAKAASSISLAAQSKTYTGKAIAYSGKVAKSGSAGKVKVDKKTGKVTVAKGTPKGTYAVQVKVTAAGNANYKASGAKAAKVTVKIR